MKKYLFITLLFCCMTAFAQNGRIDLRSTTRADIIKSDFTTLQAVFSYGSIESMELSTEKGTFSEITLPGCYPSGEIGTPELPATHQLLAVPFGANPTVTINSYSATDYKLSEYGIGTILPHQPSVRKDQKPEEVEFIYNEAAYQTRGLSAAPTASIEVQGVMRGIRVGSLVVNPLSYDAASNTLRIFNDIEVTVNFDGADKVETERMLLNTYSPYFDIVYKQMFNSRQILDVYDDHPDLMAYPVHMIVIAPENYLTALQPWINWKVQKGFDVNVVTTSQAGSNYSSIRSYVQNLYTTGVNSGATPTFLVLVGDVAQIPNTTGSSSQKVTDLYYGSVDNDYFPDMFYSRMSAENTNQLTAIINKILQYEQYTMPDPSYLNNVTLIAGWDNYWTSNVGAPTINYAATYYYNAAHGFNTVNTHVNQSQYSGCYNSLSTGVGFVNYTAHGDNNMWYQPQLTNTGVSQLTNTDKYFLAMGNCCLSGNFGNNSACFGEAMIRAENKAAYSYIGSCPNTYWYEDYYFGVGATSTFGSTPNINNTSTGVYDGVWMDDTYNTVSSMTFLGNIAVCYAHAGSYQTSSNPTYYWQAYHVLGDGSIMPYRVNPTANTVSHSNSIMLGASSFTVYAEAGSYVGISKDNVLLGAALVPASGVVSVGITPITQPGSIHIVVTKPQRQPYMADVTVINPQPGTITVEANPEEGGTVTGGGTFDYGTPCTVSATALGEYTFSSWSENGVAVSSNPEYTFTVTGDRHLVANFNLPPCYSPSALTASAVGTIINLTWQASPNGISYGIVRDGEVIADNITELEYHDTGLEPNHQYCYTVYSNCDDGGVSDPCKAACATTEAGVVVPCDPADGFEGQYIYNNENDFGVLLKWSSVASVLPVACHLYRSTDGANYELLADVLPEGGNTDFDYFDQVEVGSYYYELTMEYEVEGETCVSDPVDTSVEVTSVDELAAGFNLYPNPANEKLTVESAVEMKEVKIYNLIGGLVRSFSYMGTKTEISLEGLPNGVYFIQLVNNENTVSKRFIKQ